VPVTLHRGVLHPSKLGVGLPQHVDHYPGAGSQARDTGNNRTRMSALRAYCTKNT
jgi:hypothetical protein